MHDQEQLAKLEKLSHKHFLCRDRWRLFSIAKIPGAENITNDNGSGKACDHVRILEYFFQSNIKEKDKIMSWAYMNFGNMKTEFVYTNSPLDYGSHDDDDGYECTYFIGHNEACENGTNLRFTSKVTLYGETVYENTLRKFTEMPNGEIIIEIDGNTIAIPAANCINDTEELHPYNAADYFEEDGSDWRGDWHSDTDW